MAYWDRASPMECLLGPLAATPYRVAPERAEELAQLFEEHAIRRMDYDEVSPLQVQPPARIVMLPPTTPPTMPVRYGGWKRSMVVQSVSGSPDTSAPVRGSHPDSAANGSRHG